MSLDCLDVGECNVYLFGFLFSLRLLLVLVEVVPVRPLVLVHDTGDLVLRLDRGLKTGSENGNK